MRGLIVAVVGVALFAGLSSCFKSQCTEDGDCPSSARCDTRVGLCFAAADAGRDGGKTVDAGSDAGPVVEAPICGGTQYCWEHPLPQGASMFGIAALDANTAWAVGAAPYALRWDGSRWNEYPLPIDRGFVRDVQMTSHADVWAVNFDALLHFDGSAWRALKPPTAATLSALWVRASDDVWVTTSTGTIFRWNGTEFSQFASPGTIFATGLWGTSVSDVWLVGDEGVVFHWDGLAWTSIPSNTVASLSAVWAASPSDVWISGGEGVVLHWNGTALAQVPSNTTAGFFRVRGTSSTNVWFSGGTLLQWDGGKLTQVASPAPKGIAGVAPIGPADVWVSGEAGLLGRLAGTTWTTWGTGVSARLRGVWAATSNSAWAVGENGLVMRLTDGSWQTVASGISDNFTAVSGSSGQDVWMVTDSGEIRRWNGTALVDAPSPTTEFITAVWAAGPSDAWIATANAVYHWDGTSWTDSPGMDGGFDLSGSASDDLWLVRGDLFKWNGSTWTKSDLGNPNMRAVFALDQNNVWAVGEAGAFFAYNGTSWTQKPSNTTEDLIDIWASSSTDVWAIPSFGPILYFDGYQGHERSPPAMDGMNAVGGFGPNGQRIVGAGGGIVKFTP